MQIIKTIIIILLFSGFSTLKAQEMDLYFVNIKGTIVSADNGEPVPYAHIINPKVHGGTTSNTDGYFSINMLTEDTLIIRSIGFVDYLFTINEFPPKDKYEIKMNPVRYLLNEVTVNEKNNLKEQLGLPNAKTLDIPIELRSNTFNEKPPLIAAFFNPISYLTYHLSNSEKTKRETLKAIKSGKEWDQFSIFHNLDNIIRLTGLSGDEADEFMIYTNMNNRLPYFASQMEIEFQIMDLFFKFKKEKNSENISTAPEED
jgi:hypothetical protein